MTIKKYRLIEKSTCIILALLVGWAVFSGNAWLPAPVFIAAGIILVLSRKRVKELTSDERSNSVVEKSCYMAGLIFLFLACTSGLTLLALGRDTPVFLRAIGFTLTGSAFAFMVSFLIAKLYVSRKLGGKV